MPRGETTLREIHQQLQTWRDTAERALKAGFHNLGPAVLTGAGTSAYAAMAIEAAWPGSRAVPSTELFLDFTEPLAHRELVVSLARSGNSPESLAVVDKIRRALPHVRHLAITCNAEGSLARRPDVKALVLSERTNDRGLAMTSPAWAARRPSSRASGELRQRLDRCRPSFEIPHQAPALACDGGFHGKPRIARCEGPGQARCNFRWRAARIRHEHGQKNRWGRAAKTECGHPARLFAIQLEADLAFAEPQPCLRFRRRNYQEIAAAGRVGTHGRLPWAGFHLTGREGEVHFEHSRCVSERFVDEI